MGSSKKKGFWVLLFILIAAMLTSCALQTSTPSDAGNKDAVIGLSEKTDVGQDTEGNNEKNVQEQDIKTDSGTYTGRVDNNSIEIKISGVLDEEHAYRVCQLSDALRENFEALGLAESDPVKFEYYEREQGQPLLTKIEKITN